MLLDQQNHFLEHFIQFKCFIATLNARNKPNGMQIILYMFGAKTAKQAS